MQMTGRPAQSSRPARSRKTLQLLGLAHRAGHVVRGTDAVRGALREGRVSLVLMADDASPTQLAKIDGWIRSGDVPARRIGGRSEIGAALGAGPLSVVGVTERGFSRRILEELDAAAARSDRGPTAPGDRQTYAG